MKINYTVYDKDSKEILFDNIDTYTDAIYIASLQPNRVATNVQAGLKRLNMESYFNASFDNDFNKEDHLMTVV